KIFFPQTNGESLYDPPPGAPPEDPPGWGPPPEGPPQDYYNIGYKSNWYKEEVLSEYNKYIFNGDLCCKLWFSITRRDTLDVLIIINKLLIIALTKQRKELNQHIPQ